jgi:hypothetical protein
MHKRYYCHAIYFRSTLNFIFLKIFSIFYSYIQKILSFIVQFAVIIHLYIPPLNQLAYILYISYNCYFILHLIIHTYVSSCLYIICT